MGSVVSDVFGKNTSPPPSPDYVGAAQAQGAANKDAALASAFLSNPNIYGPYGSQTVSYSAGPDGNYIPTVRQTLDPSQQGLLNAQNSLKMGLASMGSDALGRVQNVMSSPFQFNGPGVQTSFNGGGQIQSGLDLSGIAKSPINAGTTALQAGMARLQPTINQQRTSLETQLTNQGLRPGTEAWTNSMRDQSMRENDLQNALVRDSLGLDLTANQQGYSQALGAGQFANAAQQQRFGQNQAQAQFGNEAQQQALQQQLYQRQLPLNELNAFLSGSQVSLPQFQQYTGQTIGAAPVMQGATAQGQYDLGAWNTGQMRDAMMVQGLASLGGSAMQMPGRK